MANEVSKEQMQQNIKGALESLRGVQASLNKLTENLTRTLQSDISFVVIEDAAEALDKLPEAKEAITEVMKSLKARAKTRMKDL
jgi:ABC-type transporter Mla subunit MlaD